MQLICVRALSQKYIENFMQLLISIMATKFNHCADKYNNGKLPLKKLLIENPVVYEYVTFM